MEIMGMSAVSMVVMEVRGMEMMKVRSRDEDDGDDGDGDGEMMRAMWMDMR